MHIFILDEEKPQGFAYPTKGYSSASGLMQFGQDEWKQILNNLKKLPQFGEFLTANVASRIQMFLLCFAFCLLFLVFE